MGGGRFGCVLSVSGEAWRLGFGGFFTLGKMEDWWMRGIIFGFGCTGRFLM